MNVGNGSLPSIFNQRFEVNFLQAPFNQLIPHANRTNSSSSLSVTLLASEILQAQRGELTFFSCCRWPGGFVFLATQSCHFVPKNCCVTRPTGGSCPRWGSWEAIGKVPRWARPDVGTLAFPRNYNSKLISRFKYVLCSPRKYGEIILKKRRA